MKYIFHPSSKVWPEIILLLEAVVLKWSVPIQKQLVGKWKFCGNYCKCLIVENIDHLNCLTMGREPCIRIFEECDQPASPNVEQYDNEFFRKMQQVIFGHAFEKLRSDIDGKWDKLKHEDYRSNWPGEVDFCYHIRNGVFHGNKFKITGTIHRDTQWRGAVISEVLKGKQVMGLNDGFLGLADVIALLYDLENVVYREPMIPINRSTKI